MQIVTLGGGGGHAQLLLALKLLGIQKMTAICTVADSGGSTGKLREQYKIPGWIGDLTKCVAALAGRPLSERLMSRFGKGDLEDHSVKNLLMVQMLKLYEDPVKAVEEFHRQLGIPRHYRVCPASWQDTHLWFQIGDKYFLNEHSLDKISENPLWNPEHHPVKEVALQPRVPASKEALRALDSADLIIAAPGDLHTSLLPVLCVSEIADAVRLSPAPFVYLMNLVQKRGETDGYTVSDFDAWIEKKAGRGPSHILVNDGGIPKDVLKRYSNEEKVATLVADEIARNGLKGRLITADLWGLNEQGSLRHDPQKIALILSQLFGLTFVRRAGPSL